jgi:hypothetical protein
VESDENGADAGPADDVAERTVPHRRERLPRGGHIASGFEDEGPVHFQAVHTQPVGGLGWAQCGLGLGDQTAVQRDAGDHASCHCGDHRHVHLLGEREAGLGLDERVVELARHEQSHSAVGLQCRQSDEVSAFDQSALRSAEQPVDVGQTILVEQRHLEEDRAVIGGPRLGVLGRNRGRIPTSARGQRTEAQHAPTRVDGVRGGVTGSGFDGAPTRSFGLVDPSDHMQREPLVGEQAGSKARGKRRVMPDGVAVSKL